jgi:hypothetical protein
MAPSATETVTLEKQTKNLRLDSSNPYKELSPVSIKKDIETKGGEGFEAAKVSTEHFPRR